MQNNIYILDDLFNKVELYSSIKFKIFEKTNGGYSINKTEINRLAEILGFNQKTISSLCISCNKEYPFTITKTLDTVSNPFQQGIKINHECGYLTDGYFSSSKQFFSPKEMFQNTHFSFFEYVFSCTKHEEHKYKMYLLVSIKNENLTITKIGQYPSMISIWGFDFEIYKKQLDNFNAYSDFKKAELCYADDFSAGAFTYLRRVFEKILDNYCKDKSLSDEKTRIKIEASKDKFDSRIYPLLNKLYKILSKGIHQLDDEESLCYYQYLRAIIVMQLEHIKQKDEKESQTKELNKIINEIVSKI